MRNAKYPNKFRTKEKYARALIGHYSSQYQSLDLGKEQWELPIIKVINCVSGSIDDFDGHQWTLKAIDYVKDAILPDLSREEIDMITSSYDDRAELYYFSTENEGEVRCLLKHRFPESQKEQYLEFVSRMTKDVVNAICTETLKSIPEAEKIIYQRKLSVEDRSTYPITEESKKEQSFAQRVLNEDERKPSAESKKRKVSFVEEVAVKNGRPTTQVH